MMKRITIAIDGFSSCGKSTMAKQLAATLGYVYIDTGAMYRSIAYALINKGIDPEDDGKYWLAEPDWNEGDKILLQQREKSLGFLNGVLKKEGNNG